MLTWCVVLREKMVLKGFCVSSSFRVLKNESHLVQGVLLGEDVGNRMIHHLSLEECQKLVHIDLQCEDMQCHARTPEHFFLIPIHVVTFHSKNWNLLLCLFAECSKTFR